MNHCSFFDILVIGAGPAGIVSALHAAARNRSLAVCLVDRKKQPGYPVRCGEAFGLKGFPEIVHLRNDWIKSTIVKARIVSPSGIAITLSDDQGNYIIDRKKMESDLIADAVAGGVSFFPDTTIVSASRSPSGFYECISDTGKTFTAQCLIIADGVESKIARRLGWDTSLLPSDVISCAFAGIEHDAIEPAACVFYIGRSVAPGGYAWVFSTGDHRANVGCGVLGSMCKSGMPKNLLNKFIETNFPGARTSELHCGAVPMGRWLKPLVKNGVMLVGDAGRQVNCTTGAGLSYSFFAGKVAGSIASESFIKTDTGIKCDFGRLKKYEKQWASHYGKQQRRSFALKEIMVGFTDSFLNEIAASLSKADAHALNVSRVFLKAFSKHPLHLLKVLKLFH